LHGVWKAREHVEEHLELQRYGSLRIIPPVGNGAELIAELDTEVGRYDDGFPELEQTNLLRGIKRLMILEIV
jgi:hypothetical protein